MLNLETCAIYLADDQARLVPRAGWFGGKAMSDVECSELPLLSSADTAANRVPIGEGGGVIQWERAAGEELMGPQDLMVLEGFTEPIRLAIRFGHIYENLAPSSDSVDVNSLLEELDVFQKMSGKS